MKHTIRRPFDKFTGVGVVLAFLLLFLAQSHIAYAATISVNTTDDELNADGDCSLREAITAANTNTAIDSCTAGVPGLDTITIDTNGTIVLSSALPAIFSDLTIIGPSETNLTISGNDSVRIFELTGGSFNLESVSLVHGNSDLGGAIKESVKYCV